MQRAVDVHRGDLVLARDGGRLSYAKVRGTAATGGFVVEPVDRPGRTRLVRPDEVVDHWARSAKPEGPPVGQLELDL